MINRSLILAAFGAAMVVSAPAATAQSNYGYGHNAPVRNTQCDRQRDDDKMAGGIAGALIGGLIGGAIGNEVADDDDHYRGRRGYRGHRGYRNHRGYGRHHRGKSSNDDEVIAGALIGAVLGGIAGSSMAEDSSKPCTVSRSDDRSYRQGSIPRTTDGLYGGPEIMNEPSSYPRTVRTYPASTRAPGPRTYPTTTRTYPTQTNAPTHECRTIYRETRLPDGRVERDPVTACRNGQNGEWRVESDTDDQRNYDGY